MKKITLLAAGLMLTLGAFSQVINTFPHVTDFESEGLCGTSCTGNCALTGGWKNPEQYAFPNAQTDWLSENGSTPSTNTGPDVDHTFGTATAKYVYVETSGCNNMTSHLVSAVYDFTNESAPRISFWWHMYGAAMGMMHLDVDTTGTGTWVLDVIPQWTANTNAWQFTDASLAAYGGLDSVRIRFRFITGTSFTSDAALDDITVYNPQPNDIGLGSVISGGGCGNSSCTPVNVDIVNFGSDTVDSGTQFYVSLLVNAMTTVDTITLSSDLLPGDTLPYVIMNGCVDLSGPSPVSYSAWTTWTLDSTAGNDTVANTSTGIPIIAMLPYFQDFETGQNGWTINNGAAGTWAFGTPAKTVIIGASSGVNCFVNGGLTGDYNNNDNSYVEGPCFDFTNVCDPVISVDVWWNAEFSWDGMNIVTSIDGGVTWQLVGAMGDQTNWYNDNTVVGNPGGYQSAWSGRTSSGNGSNGWVNARHHLTGCGNQPNVKIRFYFASDGSVIDDGTAFDNVRIYDGAWIGADQTICSPATATLNADGGYPASVTYAWSTGATTASITASATGWYWVDVTNGSCVKRDSMYLVVIDSNSDVALGADSTTCAASIMLDAGYWPGSTYLWSDSSTAQMLNATASGMYSVTVTTPCGTMTDSINVTIDPAVVNLGSDFAACSWATLDAGAGFTTYTWSTGSTAQMDTVMTSGTYYVDVVNATGCMDSDTVMVTINTPPTVAVSGTSPICSGSSSMLMASGAGTYQWVNGPAGDMYTVMPSVDTTYWVVGTDTTTGCTDSASFMVEVNYATSFSQSVNVCYGDSLMIGSNTYTMSGTYMDTLMNVAGCDSVVTTMLTVDSLIWSSQSFSGCSGFTVTVGSNTYSQTGVYSDTLAAINGCDSVVTTNLQIAPPLTSSQSFTICDGDSVMVGSSVYTTAGTYTDSLTTSMGCDSIVTTSIAVTTVNVATTVTGNGVVLSAVNTGATAYQWIDCNTMQPIAGATSSSYTATANGMYAVIITDQGCSDTSACINVTNVGIDDPSVSNVFSVFPNPTYGSVTITSSIATEVVIYNTLGEVVMAQGVQNTVTLDLTSLEGGVYFIRTTEGKIVRLVKE